MLPMRQNLTGPRAEHPPPTREELKTALNLFARLVDKFGSDYLPFFLRIEKELNALEEQNSALTRARALARVNLSSPN